VEGGARWPIKISAVREKEAATAARQLWRMVKKALFIGLPAIRRPDPWLAAGFRHGCRAPD
jgi:hypothetical protein